MNRNTLLTAVAALSLASFAAVPVRWSADTYKVKPLVYECYHGETLDLAASLTAYGEPLALGGKTVHLFWQTNGMDEAVWFQANGEVRVDPACGATNVLAATWSGANDGGADKVVGFIGVDGENYRASFELRLRYSPGFVPNHIPPPVKVIDCEKVTWLHPEAAPFSGGGTLPGQVTNIAEYVTGNATNGLPEAIAAKYTLPAGGIPAGDIAAGVIPFVPDVTLVWTNNTVKTKDGATSIGAADVGARADTWMPSAEDIPGAAYDFMATAFNFGTGSSITRIEGNEVYIGIGDEGFLTVGTLDYGGTLTVAGTNVMDAISSKFDNSKTNDLLSVAMSASESYCNGATNLIWQAIGDANAYLESALGD